jgi:uncharacterized protein (DUF169 family)
MLDYTVFNNLSLDYAPVAVKFSLARPKSLPKLGKKLSVCEMIREAQDNGGFYAEYDNHVCQVGPYILGQIDPDPGMVSGQIGPHLGVYGDASANRQIYLNMPRLQRGTGTYTLFAKLHEATFEPDLVILVAKPSVAEIVLRARGYRSGKGWNAYGTSVAGCACLFMRPYLTGEMNMMVTGLHHGMKVRNIYPEGLLMLSIPFQIMPEMISSLKEMPWELPQYSWGKETHIRKMKEISQKIAAEISGE